MTQCAQSYCVVAPRCRCNCSVTSVTDVQDSRRTEAGSTHLVSATVVIQDMPNAVSSLTRKRQAEAGSSVPDEQPLHVDKRIKLEVQ